MHHIIKKQVINLTLDTKLNAYRIQQLVSEHYWKEVVPVLEKAFDAVSSEEEIIRLDKLEFDLGFIDAKDIEKGKWEEDVLKKISEQLDIIKKRISSSEIGIKQQTAISISDQWMYYMQHGHLPWNMFHPNDMWYKNVLGAFAVDSAAIHKLRYIIQNNPYAVKRIIFQHPENFLESLIETLTSEKQNTLHEIINEISEVIDYLEQQNELAIRIKDKQLRIKLWQDVLIYSAVVEKNQTSEKLAYFLLNRYFKSPKLIQTLPPKFLSKNKITGSIINQIKEITETEEEKERDNIISAENKIIEETDISNKNKIDEEGIFIQFAGIVLLHPFLAMFFKHLNLIEKENFVNDESHQKAMVLLHYLATGMTEPQEHELVMAKVLCAYPVKKPVDTDIKPDEHELNEADILLKEIIQQWEILKGTSPDGLREGFLQRNGKLYSKNDNLIVQVESSSIDVLLDRLPWNLSMIKLPWMKDILRIEWR